MLHFVYNPVSGKGRTTRTLKKLTRYCDRNGAQYVVHKTEYAGHIKTIIAELEAQGGADVVVLGGDGTFHEALNSITDFDRIRLGLIPCGSGNDFVSSGNFHKGKPLRMLKIILAGKTKKIDYIQFDCGLRCLNIAGTGLDIEVLKVARAYRRLTGSPNYIGALLRVIKNFDPYTVTVTADGETRDYSCILVAAANGTQFGGGIKVSPLSSISDGKLDLMIIKMVERSRIKYIVPQFIIGKHIGKDFAVHERVDRIEVTSPNKMLLELDGETYNVPFACSVVPQALTIFYED